MDGRARGLDGLSGIGKELNGSPDTTRTGSDNRVQWIPESPPIDGVLIYHFSG